MCFKDSLIYTIGLTGATNVIMSYVTVAIQASQTNRPVEHMTVQIQLIVVNYIYLCYVPLQASYLVFL